MLLAIDTATPYLSLALRDGDALLAECTLKVGLGHSAALAPLIKQTMAQVGAAPEDVTALACCIGPGSYTGLRIGLALAKGMAAARDLPLAPATSLDIIAAGQDRCCASDLVVTLPAGRKRVIWALYTLSGGRWTLAGQPEISEWSELLAARAGAFALTGEITAQGLAQAKAAMAAGREIAIVPAAGRLRRAGYLAEIAWQRLNERGRAAFPAERALPLYLKSP